MLWLSHVQGEIIDKVGQYRLAVWSDVVFVTCTRGDNRQGRTIWSGALPCRLSPLVHVTNTTFDHTARRYCPTLSIIYPCTCDKHNIWPHCKTILSYLVDYLPLYMWQTQHLTTLQDDIVLLYRLSPLVHVTTTTSDQIARRYCPTLSIISPCTCDKHHIWQHCKTQMLCLSHVQGEIIDKVGQYRLAMWSDVVFVTCTRGDNRQGRTISSCSGVRCCVCHMYKGR
jgi:hypothetical protein